MYNRFVDTENQSRACDEATRPHNVFLYQIRKKKKKSKAVPLHAMEAHWGRGGIAPTHS
jgi:hypothetical protein